MKYATRQSGMAGSAVVGRLGMPPQAAPIERTATGAALGEGAGVEPSIFGAILPFLAPALSAVSKLL